MSFKFLDLIHIHRKLKQTLYPCWQKVARVCFSFLWTCWWLKKKNETGQVWKLVLHHQKKFKSLDRATKSLCLVSSLVPDQSTKLMARATAPQWYCWKLHFSKIYKRKCALNQKVCFCFRPLKLFHYYSRLNTKHKWLKDPRTAKAFSSPEHIYKNVEHHGKLTPLGDKAEEPKSTLAKKKAQIRSFFELKASWNKI